MAYVQSAINGVNGATLTITFDTPPSVGNLVVVLFCGEVTTLGNVTDNATGNGNYNAIVNVISPGSAGQGWIYAKKIVATNTPFTVSVDLGGTHFMNGAIHEYSGISADTTSDTNTNTAASGTTVSTNTVSPAAAATVVALCNPVVMATTMSDPGNSFNKREEDPLFNFAVMQTADKTGVSGSQSTSWTITDNQEWLALIAAFAESGGGSGAPGVAALYLQRRRRA